MTQTRLNPIFISTLLLCIIHSNAWAGQDISEIQKQFNAETATKPFSVPDDASLTAALKEATQRGTPTKTRGYTAGCIGLGCIVGQNFGYGSYFGGYARPYYGGFYGVNAYNPYYYGW